MALIGTSPKMLDDHGYLSTTYDSRYHIVSGVGGVVAKNNILNWLTGAD